MAWLFRLGNATYRYQQLADGEVTEEDYRHWLEGLPERFRKAMEKGGFAGAKSSLVLRRHALERRDVGYSAFMQAILSPEDWAFEQLSSSSALPQGCRMNYYWVAPTYSNGSLLTEANQPREPLIRPLPSYGLALKKGPACWEVPFTESTPGLISPW
jgi:hypothetical protein